MPDDRPAAAPVFVDPTGRRRRTIRRTAVLGACLLLGVTGLIIAALIIGAAMLMRVETSFRILGYPGFAMILFSLAAGGGIWLVASILAKDMRARRKHPKSR